MSLFRASRAANLLTVELKETAMERVVEVRPLAKTKEAAASGIVSQDALQTAARLRVLLGPTGKMVAVTGVAEEDGATRLAGSLGRGLATITESPVLIVDANVHAPRLHEIYRISQSPGLLNVLDDETDVESCVHRLELSNLFVMPLGHSSSSLAALLSKPENQDVLEGIRQKYRYLVIDTGLVAAGADGVLLASLSDGVVAAIAAGIRRRHEVVQFQQELKRLRIPLLGLVLTKES